MSNNKGCCGICADCVPQIDGGSGFGNCEEAHAAQLAEDRAMDSRLLDIGNCLIDASLVVSVEPYRHGYQGKYTGALIKLSGGETVIETYRTLDDVKAAIQAARTPAYTLKPHSPGMPPRHP